MVQMHIAQYLSFFRLFLSPLALIYLYPIPYKMEIFLAIVLIGAASDYLDGYLARSQGKTSHFGSILDFTADKVFVLSVLIVLSVAGDLPVWICFVIFYRELLVMGMRIFAAFHKMNIPSSKLGKWKTTITFMAICALIVKMDLYIWLFVIAIALTLISFFDYVRHFRLSWQQQQ